jgi:hypothetical protein
MHSFVFQGVVLQVAGTFMAALDAHVSGHAVANSTLLMAASSPPICALGRPRVSASLIAITSKNISNPLQPRVMSLSSLMLPIDAVNGGGVRSSKSAASALGSKLAAIGPAPAIAHSLRP